MSDNKYVGNPKHVGKIKYIQVKISTWKTLSAYVTLNIRVTISTWV